MYNIVRSAVFIARSLDDSSTLILSESEDEDLRYTIPGAKD